MASYRGAVARVTADLAVPSSNRGEALGDSYASVENLTGTAFNDRLSGDTAANRLVGGEGSDVLIGRAANDILKGDLGNDLLFGNEGKDVLVGGPGADVFRFTRVADSPSAQRRDVIRDFSQAQGDVINLASIDANTQTIGNQAFLVDTNGTFSAGEIKLQGRGSSLIVSLNQDNDVAAEMSFYVLGLTSLQTSDFVL